MSGAHPCLRGENRLNSTRLRSTPGSSPRERGKPTLPIPYQIIQGLIPTHAGKTGYPHTHLVRPGAHPHSRGENHREINQTSTTSGSSPLTRGKHFANWGFTPQIGQILESLESCAYAEIYSLPVAYATDSRDRAQNTDRAPQSSKGASSK